jgi:hypothetical protein
MDKDPYTITIESSDTISYDDINYTIDTSSLTLPSFSGNVTIASGGTSGSYLYSTAGLNGTSWTTTAPSPDLHVKGDAEIDGDIKVKGRSLEKMLQKIEDRLAIISDPDPAKLEKYAALKKAYEHYKTLERLIGED